MQIFPIKDAKKQLGLKALLLELPAKELNIPRRGTQTRRVTPQPPSPPPPTDSPHSPTP
jgi:hypothetical protein